MGTSRTPHHLSIDRRVTVVLIEHDTTIALGLADHVTVHRGRVIIERPPAIVQGDPQVPEVYLGHV